MTGRSCSHHGLLACSAFLILLAAAETSGFSFITTKKHLWSTPTARVNYSIATSSIDDVYQSRNRSSKKTVLYAKATKKKKKAKGGGGGAVGIKGFGAPSSGGGGSSGNDGVATTDRSKEARAFYDFLEKEGAGDNLRNCALGYFPLPSSFSSSTSKDDKNDNNNSPPSLRGVVAMRDLKKGDIIIRIPYEAAVNLGQEGGDPTLPALKLLRDYCEVLGKGAGDVANSKRRPYYEMLPPFRGEDCLGSTDFFSGEALEALQAPLIVEETLKRRERTKGRFQRDVAKERTEFPGFDEEVANDDNDFPAWIESPSFRRQLLRSFDPKPANPLGYCSVPFGPSEPLGIRARVVVESNRDEFSVPWDLSCLD